MGRNLDVSSSFVVMVNERPSGVRKSLEFCALTLGGPDSSTRNIGGAIPLLVTLAARTHTLSSDLALIHSICVGFLRARRAARLRRRRVYGHTARHQRCMSTLTPGTRIHMSNMQHRNSARTTHQLVMRVSRIKNSMTCDASQYRDDVCGTWNSHRNLSDGEEAPNAGLLHQVGADQTSQIWAGEKEENSCSYAQSCITCESPLFFERLQHEGSPNLG